MFDASISRALAAVALVAGSAASAFAQDYTVSTPTGLYQAPPTGAATVSVSNAQTRAVTLPFAFPYFGASYSSAFVCGEGFLQVGVTSGNTSGSNATFPRTGTTDGMIAPYWDDLALNLAGSVREWTTGATPSRVWIVSWEGVALAANSAARITFQVHLFEDTGRVEFAYKPDTAPSTWPSSTYTPGIDAFGASDTRSVTPSGMNTTGNSGHPPSDFRFDPTIRAYTGQLLYDRVASDAGGVGNAVFFNQPLARVRVELRNAAGVYCGAGTTSANGSFSVGGVALPASGNGSLVALAQGASCVVRTVTGGAAYSRTIVPSVSLAAGSDVGVFMLTAASDPGGTFLPAFHAATVTGSVHAAVAPLTTDTISQLEILYDNASTSRTSFTRAAPPAAAQMRVGSPASGNPDGWDSDVIMKTYGGQVLGRIAAYSTASYDAGFDTVSTAENAFAEGFGYAVFAVVTGRGTYVDATSATAGTTLDLEAPTLVSRKGPDVAGWVAAALFDLVDPPNEGHDLADGTGAQALVGFSVVDGLTAPVTATSFHAAWGAQGRPGGGALTRDFVFHGLLADDAFESNDSTDEAAALGAAGQRRTGLVLNRYDEDWFGATLSGPADSIVVELDYDRATITAGVAVEIRSAAGALLATGVAQGPVGPAVLATSGAVGAGTYRVRVQHVSGDRVAAYALQVSAKLTLGLGVLGEWTVDRPISSPAPIAGGVPPYTFSIEQPFAKPPGLILDAANQVIYGQPTEAGSYSFILTVKDSGSPQHKAASIVQTFVVNPALDLPAAEFVGLPLSRAFDFRLPRTGGTAPFRFDVTGELPAGTALSADELRFTGTASAAGAWPLDIAGEDAAGSTDASQTTAVVCVPSDAAATLLHAAAGTPALGLFFDAVAGSSVSVAVKTARGSPKLLLRPVVIGSDGAVLVTGKLSGGEGKAKAAGVICPASGRYYVVLAAQPGESSDLTASLKVVAPKGGAGGDPVFDAVEFVDVEVGALPGAVVTLTAKTDKRSGLSVRALALLDPSGASVPIDGLVTEKGSGFTLTATLPIGGTWRIRIGGKPGNSGQLKYAYKLKQPKGGVFQAD